MENYLIYQDENTQIEIDGRVHFWLNYMRVKMFYPNRTLRQVIFNTSILPDIKKNISNMGQYKISMCSNAPILQYGKEIGLSAPFDIFNNAINYLSYSEDIAAAEDEINSLVNSDNIYCKIFKDKKQDIQGYLYGIKDELIYIIFFGYDDNPPDMILL
jgi:hypothetical protein